MKSADYLIIGGGIAGAAAAYGLAPHGQVLMLEAEDTPCYHTTGRSAAFYAETYGGPDVQPLTTGSKAFFDNPPSDFSAVPLWDKRGALHVVKPGDLDQARAMAAQFAALSSGICVLDAAEARAKAPMLRQACVGGGVWDPDCALLDVDALHQGFMRAARRHGFKLYCNAPVQSLLRRDGLWRAETPKGVFQAPVLVNAAGAWGDRIAKLAQVEPLGLTPMRRTIVTFPVPGEGADPDWPLVLDMDGKWYFKTQRGRILASPADETPSPPCDAQPEELDIALTMAQIEAVTGWNVSRLNATWAGLRTFAPDRAPVIGFDDRAEGFFWCVGQGGVGIQTAPAVAQLAAAAVTGGLVPEALGRLGITADRYAPKRLREAA